MDNTPFIKKTVFGSKAERALYNALNTKWDNKFHIFPSLPFANLVNFEGVNLKEKEREFLFKTSIDFTLCDKATDKPILSIDFDGMGYGFSRNGEYIEISPSSDYYRKLKFDLKLKIARQAHYNYFIVSYKETENLDPTLHLTIVDGIIGEILADNRTRDILQERGKELNDILSDEPNPSIRNEVISDFVVEAEVEADFEWNPFVKKKAELEEEMRKNGIFCISSEFRPLTEYSLPVRLDLPTHNFASRMKTLELPTWVGWEVTVEWTKIKEQGAIIGEKWNKDEGLTVTFKRQNENVAESRKFETTKVKKSVLIRNHDLFSASLSADMAELLAYNEVHKRAFSL